MNGLWILSLCQASKGWFAHGIYTSPQESSYCTNPFSWSGLGPTLSSLLQHGPGSLPLLVETAHLVDRSSECALQGRCLSAPAHESHSSISSAGSKPQETQLSTLGQQQKLMVLMATSSLRSLSTRNGGDCHRCPQILPGVSQWQCDQLSWWLSLKILSWIGKNCILVWYTEYCPPQPSTCKPVNILPSMAKGLCRSAYTCLVPCLEMEWLSWMIWVGPL